MSRPVTYAEQPEWREIQAFLPAKYHLADKDLPVEEFWDWNGHKVHLDRYRHPDSPVRVILFHGVGTNGRQMSTILGHPLSEAGIETVAVDMPNYGLTQVASGRLVLYDDWVQCGTDFIAAELARDPRPIFLYGLSAGGMLTYHVAARSRKVAGIIGMTFLDQRAPGVFRETAYTPLMGPFLYPTIAMGKLPLIRGISLPMRALSKMRALVNDRQAMQVCYRDRTSAGNVVSLGFMSSYLGFQPDIRPEDFDICPILLTQPAEDHWTPHHLSEKFLSRITKVPVSTVMLENAGHYPLEEPGLTQMYEAILDFIGGGAGASESPPAATT